MAKIDISNQYTNVSYNDIAEIMTNAADITLGKVRTKKQVWITDELLCDERRRLKPLKKLSNENERQYRSVNTILRKSMKDTKEKWIQNQCLAIENEMKIGRHSIKRPTSTVNLVRVFYVGDKIINNLIYDLHLYIRDRN